MREPANRPAASTTITVKPTASRDGDDGRGGSGSGAQALGAALGECSNSSDDARGRSYAPRGKQPVVRPCHRRENVELISAVINKGAVRWMVLKKATDAPLLIEFMRRLVREARRKVFLILDGLPAQKRVSVTTWLAGHRDQIERK